MAEEPWFVMVGDTRSGPLSTADVKRQLAIGSLAEDSLVWRTGQLEWLPANGVEALRDPAASATVLEAGVPAEVAAIIGGGVSASQRHESNLHSAAAATTAATHGPVRAPNERSNAGEAGPVVSETVLCPHCAEPIKTAAKVCKHCGRRVVGILDSPTAATAIGVLARMRAWAISHPRLFLAGIGGLLVLVSISVIAYRAGVVRARATSIAGDLVRKRFLHGKSDESSGGGRILYHSGDSFIVSMDVYFRETSRSEREHRVLLVAFKLEEAPKYTFNREKCIDQAASDPPADWEIIDMRELNGLE